MKAFGPSQPGPSAYDVAVAGGFVGDEAAWLLSLRGDDGDDGQRAGYRYVFNDSISIGDPGTGGLSFNASSPSSTFALCISETDADGRGLAAIIGSWDDRSSNPVRGVLSVVDAPGVDAAQFWITGPITDSGAYRQIPVSGLGSPFEDGDEVYVTFAPAGDKGDVGRGAGVQYRFNTSTSSGDPGAGRVKFNHASPASATVVRISETDDDGAALATLLAAWDDGTSALRGTLYVRSVFDAAAFAAFDVTGSMTDAGTYDEFAVAHRASGGTFGNLDYVTVCFVPKGDAGDAGPSNIPSGGSASAPGLPVSGDANTGIWSPGADLLAVAAGGAEVSRFGGSTYAVENTGTVRLNGRIIRDYATISGLSTGAYDSFSPTASGFAVKSKYYLVTSVNLTFTGWDQGSNLDGEEVDVIVVATGGATVTFTHEGTGTTTAANRFAVEGAASLVCVSGEQVRMHKAGAPGRWRIAKLGKDA